MAFTVRPIKNIDRPYIDAQISKSWSGPYVVSKNVLHDTRTHTGFIAVENDVIIGYILYNISNGDCEITVLESLSEGRGVGSALINEVFGVAKESDCLRIWLVTTNDNIHAIRFYQRRGFELKAVYIDAMDQARKLKPQIPMAGNDDIPIKHEFEFELVF